MAETLGGVENDEGDIEVTVHREGDTVHVVNHVLEEEPVTVAEMDEETAESLGESFYMAFEQEAADVDIPEPEEFNVGQHPLSNQVVIYNDAEDKHAVFTPKEAVNCFPRRE